MKRAVPRPDFKAVLWFCLAVCAAGAGPAGAADRISLGKPLVSADQPALAGSVSDVLDQASAVIARLYSGAMTIAPAGSGGADYTLSVIASLDKDTLSLVIGLTRTADGYKTPTLAWSAPATPDLPLWIARAVFLLWSSTHACGEGGRGAGVRG
jgi:hypothetical protein